MSGFGAEWLALREPADHAARSAALTAAVAAMLTTKSPLRVLDLACGAGSNLRYMLDRLAGPQEWLLADHDPALLAIALPRMRVARKTERLSAREQSISSALGGTARGIFDGRAIS